MNTFQIKSDGTVISFPCMTTNGGCRVNRMLLLEDTTDEGHHVMIMPWEVEKSEMERSTPIDTADR